MSTHIYQTKVVGWGNSALDFLGDRMVIFFNKQAQGDLAEYSVLLDDLDGEGEFSVGDTLCLGAEPYAITAVGEVANTNFRQLGHMVVHFDGKEVAGLPGEIHVEDRAIEQITIGLPVVLKKNKGV